MATTTTTETLIQSANSTAEQYSGMSILQSIFGQQVADPLGMLSVGGSTTVMGGMFSVLNLAIMAVATIFLTYNILASITQTAHDGEFLGKRFDTIWMPIRTIVGLGSLVPAFGGLALCQIIMLWFSVMGVGIGNMVWSQAVDFVAKGGSLVTVAPTSQDRQLTEFLAASAICRVSAQTGAFQATNDPAYVVPGAFDDAGSIKFGWSNGAQCGALAIPSPTLQISAAQRQAVRALDNQLIQVAEQHVQNVMSNLVGGTPAPRVDWSSTIPRLAAQYHSDLDSRMKSVMAATASTPDALTAAMVADAKNRGWTGAGSWYNQLAGVTTKVNSLRSLRPEITQPVSPPDDVHFNGMRSVYVAAASSFNISQRFDPAHSLGIWDKIGGAFGCDAGGLGPCIVAQITSIGTNQSALVRMHNLGDWVATGGTAAIPIIGGIKGAAEAVGDSALAKGVSLVMPGAGDAARGAVVGAVEATADSLSMAARAATIAGIFMSTYLPLLPAVMWMAGIITWVIVVIEAVAAAPLWALTHLDGGGDGMGQRTQHGYLFLLNVLFRPALMIFGFVTAGIVVDVMGGFWTSIFGQAVASAQVDSMTGIVAVVAYICIYAIVCVSIVNLSFNAIHVIPDNTLNWLGGQLQNTLGRGAEQSITHDFKSGSSSSVSQVRDHGNGRNQQQPDSKKPQGARKL